MKGWPQWVAVGWLILGTPVYGLTLELKTPTSIVRVEDNGAQDRDPEPARIHFQGTLDERSSHPVQLDLSAQETQGQNQSDLSLSSAEEGVTNLGEPTTLEITLSSQALQLNAPITLGVKYRGGWSDVTDARQEIRVSQQAWLISTGEAPLLRLVLDPIASAGKPITVEKSQSTEVQRPISSLKGTFRVNWGGGDALNIEGFTLHAESQNNPWSRWWFLGIGAVVLAMLSLGWFSQRRRRTRRR